MNFIELLEHFDLLFFQLFKLTFFLLLFDHGVVGFPLMRIAIVLYFRVPVADEVLFSEVKAFPHRLMILLSLLIVLLFYVPDCLLVLNSHVLYLLGFVSLHQIACLGKVLKQLPMLLSFPLVLLVQLLLLSEFLGSVSVFLSRIILTSIKTELISCFLSIALWSLSLFILVILSSFFFCSFSSCSRFSIFRISSSTCLSSIF